MGAQQASRMMMMAPSPFLGSSGLSGHRGRTGRLRLPKLIPLQRRRRPPPQPTRHRRPPPGPKPFRPAYPETEGMAPFGGIRKVKLLPSSSA